MWFYNIIDDLSRRNKIIIILFTDLVSAYFAIYISIFLRLDKIWDKEVISECFEFLVLLPFIIVISSYILETYKLIISFFNFNDIEKLLKYSIIISLFFSFINFLFDTDVPRSIPILFGISFFSVIVLIRLFFQSILRKKNTNKSDVRKKVIVYGAGAAGIHLLRRFEANNLIEILGFIDDNPKLKGLKIDDKNIYNRDSFIHKYSNSKIIDEIWIAVPSLETSAFSETVDFCQKYSPKVLALPTLNKLLATGKIESNLKEVNPSTFLNRDEVDINEELFGDVYLNKNILITGGGGSIGSELAIQLVKLNPKSIVLLESSEHALYSIEIKLIEICDKKNIKIIPILGNICNSEGISDILVRYEIEILIHAAAYKHVPLVESNNLEGINNNVIGTYNLICSAVSSESSLERFIFVSSDKAVRPSSIMGKTKRISEKIVQTFAKNSQNINFGIVRFGNVLGSSGSVIPLFKKQISNGGPLTITDPEMTRFFMSIEEASQLVLLSGTYAKKAEIFILDMGNPVKIIDLAKNMIKFYGYNLETENSEKQKIEIKIINKRPGEKLHEELLINNSSKKTSYPKVMIDDSENKTIEDIDDFMNNIKSFINSRNEEKVLNIIDELSMD